MPDSKDGSGKMKRTPHRFASGFSSSFAVAPPTGPRTRSWRPLNTDVGGSGGTECPRCARNASTSRTVSRGRQATSRLLRSATALRVTAAADRAGSSYGPARRLALVPRTECAAPGPDATSTCRRFAQAAPIPARCGSNRTPSRSIAQATFSSRSATERRARAWPWPRVRNDRYLSWLTGSRWAATRAQW